MAYIDINKNTNNDTPRPSRELSSSIAQDFREALGSFRSNPGFKAIVVLTLAMGIGANSSIFTLMDQVLLRYLPVREPDRLFQLSPWDPVTWIISFTVLLTVAIVSGYLPVAHLDMQRRTAVIASNNQIARCACAP